MHTWFHVQLDQKILKGLYCKGGSMEETLMHKFSPHSKLEFNFPVFQFYLLKNCHPQFLRHWELAETVFSSEELSCLP